MKKRTGSERADSASAVTAPSARGAMSWLVALLSVAAAVRLFGLDAAPPGVNQDEALSAWNGWTLLKTGHALSGETWPVFHTRNLGDYPTTLFFYTLLPFQWLFGLSVWSTRLPAALAGIASVWCAWDLGRRLGGNTAGLAAAGVMAVAPWSIFLGHFGTGASLGPLQALLPLVFLARSGLVPALGPGAARARPAWALAAGVAFGLGVYGFHSLRLQLPLTLAAALLAGVGMRRTIDDDAPSRGAWVSLLAGFLVFFVPMAYVTWMDPVSLERWRQTRLWAEGASPAAIVALVAERWLIHFSPDFLFQRGDRYAMLNPARIGALAWWMLPGLLVGMGLLVRRFAGDARARLLLFLLMLYPIGDLMSANDGVHSLRSSAGLPALALVVGLGIEALVAWLRGRGRAVLAAALALVAVVELAAFGVRFFRDAPRERGTQIEYQVALLEAGRWLGSRLAPADHVFCTTTGMNQPFVVLLLALRYDAERWRTDSKDIVRGDFDRYRSFGRLHFIYDDTGQARIQELEADGRSERVWFLVRPGEFSLTEPVHRITAPDGEEMLWVCERSL